MKEFAVRAVLAWKSASERSSRRMRWLPLVISGLALAYVGQRLWEEGPGIWQALWPPSAGGVGLIALALILMPLNWLLEAVKWQRMVRTWYPDLRLGRAFQAVLCGLSTGIFTPNRVGEYPGRIMTLAPGRRWQAATSMLLDRLVQMVVTIWLGLAAAWLLAPRLEVSWLSKAMSVGHFWLPVALLLPWVAFAILPRMASRLPGTGISARVKEGFLALNLSLGLQLLGLSLVRNLVFTSQYFLLLLACGTSLDWQWAFGLIWLIFLAKSVIPTWTFAELGIRETLAIAVLGWVGVSAATAFSATFLLYLINLLLPALWGLRWIHRISWS